MIIDLFAGPGGRETEAGCWVGLGTANGNGYRTVRVNGRKVYLHRLSYEVHIADIPDGLTLDHLTCDNRECFNPWHLDPVPNAVNILRGDSPPARNARKTACPKGHAYVTSRDGTRVCPPCRLARRIERGESSGIGRPADRTHCPTGHAFSAENTYLVRRPDGSVKQRACRECSRQRVRARRAAARQESAA